ncbi:cyclin-dependent kinase [Strigomonas culicis]|uniref:cyclin-dependent kinase n=1 Tax=Strigomonas culicis TaxID=28005 RepID=S9UTH5_9TRYP|nr:cyclin-dependent kinase [Strigomonas culicis]|eukprot:EPY32188.1 cyclin-dependent kinase [Strigomonas culicis]
MSTQGRYSHIVRLGEGTYGAVYKATEKDTGKVIAFKRMNAVSDDDGVPGIAIREVCLLKELRHQNLVELFDVLFDSKKITLIFEFCDFDLKQYMETKPKRCLDAEEVQPALKQIFAGLHYLHHRSVVHRDIKPQNVFLNIRPSAYSLNSYAQHPNGPSDSNGGGSNHPDGDGARVATAPPENRSAKQLVAKLGDFGLARVENIPVKKYSHEAVTLWYRSPDVLLGSALYSFPVDIWSMGVMFFEMVTGRILFAGHSDEEQLVRMFRLLGSPTKDTWPSMLSYPSTSDRVTRARQLVAMAASGPAPAGGGSSKAGGGHHGDGTHRMLTCYSSALTQPAPPMPDPPPQNTCLLPEELWFPQSLFQQYMTSTGFRAVCGEDGVDLIRRCLMYEPSKRITAAEALRHPFLRNVQTPKTGYLDNLMTALQQSLEAAGI